MIFSGSLGYIVFQYTSSLARSVCHSHPSIVSRGVAQSLIPQKANLAHLKKEIHKVICPTLLG